MIPMVPRTGIFSECNQMHPYCRKLRHLLSLITVEPVLFLYMLIMFMEMNTLQSLFYTKICLQNNGSTTECAHQSESNSTSITNIVAETSTWNKYYNSCLSLCTLLVSFYVAAWSDRFSRKIPMLVAPIGTLIASVVNTVLSVFINLHVSFFMISAVISGFTFGTVAVIASTFGFLSDIVSKEERTKRIVILETMIFSGGTVGVYLAGAILHNTDINGVFNDYAKVFILEMILAAVIIFYIILRIPYHSQIDDEGLLLPDSTEFSCSQLFSLAHFKDVGLTIFKQRDHDRRKQILLLLLALLFVYFGSALQITVFFLFVKNEPLKWNITQYSNFNAVQFAVQGTGLLLGLPIAFHVLHIPDLIIAIIGVVSRIAGLVLFGFSNSKAMIYSCAGLFLFAEFPVSTIRSMLSKLVDESEKGRMFACTSILQNVSYFTASMILPTIFRSSLSFFPGFCFEVVAAMQALSVLIFCYLYFTRKNDVPTYVTTVNDDSLEGACNWKA